MRGRHGGAELEFAERLRTCRCASRAVAPSSTVGHFAVLARFAGPLAPSLVPTAAASCAPFARMVGCQRASTLRRQPAGARSESIGWPPLCLPPRGAAATALRRESRALRREAKLSPRGAVAVSHPRQLARSIWSRGRRPWRRGTLERNA